MTTLLEAARKAVTSATWAWPPSAERRGSVDDVIREAIALGRFLRANPNTRELEAFVVGGSDPRTRMLVGYVVAFYGGSVERLAARVAQESDGSTAEVVQTLVFASTFTTLPIAWDEAREDAFWRQVFMNYPQINLELRAKNTEAGKKPWPATDFRYEDGYAPTDLLSSVGRQKIKDSALIAAMLSIPNFPDLPGALTYVDLTEPLVANQLRAAMLETRDKNVRLVLAGALGLDGAALRALGFEVDENPPPLEISGGKARPAVQK